MKNQIQLIQVPKFEHQLKKVGESIKLRIEGLNLANQVANEDTVKALKLTRAELNKENKELTEHFKATLAPAVDPVAAIKEMFKTEATIPYKEADDTLKTLILSHENKVKDEKRKEIVSYFNELCTSEGIDFVKIESVDLKIDLSTSVKKLKEQCNTFIAKVQDDLVLIASQTYVDEITIEYKKTLNVSKSVTDVVERKRLLKEAEDKAKQAAWDKRVNAFRDIAVVYHSTTKVFSYNDKIYVSEAKVKELDDEQFKYQIISMQKDITAYQLEAKPIEPIASPTQQNTPEPKKEAAKPLEKPTTVKLETVTATFEVEATLPVLKKLVAYMNENEITFKDL